MKLRPQIPEKLEFLLYPKRYKVAYGGRGSSKSWTFARVLLCLGVLGSLRILCTREVQNSIKDSVHQLLKDQIESLSLGQYYKVLDTEIRGTKNDTKFLFTGLSTHTIDSLKSYEGIDICWVEEAQNVKKRSWDILIPTIRKETDTRKSEIWISFNPDLETDETYQRFVLNPPANSHIEEVNWRDNPWFNNVLNEERLHCQENDPDNYPNIWEGKCRPAVEGAIYYKEIVAAEQGGRITHVPIDPMLKTHVVFDLGWNDWMFIALVQRSLSSIRIVKTIAGDHQTLAQYSAELKEMKLNWGKVWLPHDGFTGDFKTGKTTYQIMKKLGWDVVRKLDITQMGLENGIKYAKLTFPTVYFDKDGAALMVENLKRYRRRVNVATNESGSPVKDDNAHGADCFRYVCLNADNMTNESYTPKPNVVSYGDHDFGVGM